MGWDGIRGPGPLDSHVDIRVFTGQVVNLMRRDAEVEQVAHEGSTAIGVPIVGAPAGKQHV